MDSHHLRAILLKLQDRLSDDDRKRLHFFLGNDVPRRIRDDPSLGGTLCLLESLFDQDKINEQDFTYLINAFAEIQCMDAVKLLRAHMTKIQSIDKNQSVQSLLLLMPSLANQVLQDQDDKYSLQSHLIDSTKIFDNIKKNSVTDDDNNQRKSVLSFKQKHLLSQSSRIQKCLLLFILLSIILVGVIIGCCIWIIRLKIKYNILNDQTNNNDTIQYMKQIQAKYDVAIQIWTKKMKNILKKELKNFKRICLENSFPRLGVTTTSMIVNSYKTFFEDLACLEACYKCTEDYPLSSRKRRAVDNCGPMCDCANSCSVMPIEQIDKIYGQSNFTRDDKDCFWRTYTESMNNEMPFSP